MGRKSKLKKQRKTEAQSTSPAKETKPKGDIETMTHLGYGKHNQLRSPDVPVDRPEPQL